MHIKQLIPIILVGNALSAPSQAESMMSHHDVSPIYHMIQLETDYGFSEHDQIFSWELDGWIGTDENKLWIKSEGERTDGQLETVEFWALYSRNISTFWDAQAGIRYDNKPESTFYAVLGIDGLAPYYFETEAHAFVSDKGDVTARVRTENDFLLTQKLILQPYAELNLSAQKVDALDLGAGLTDAQIGLQARYEITRKFAPYLDVHYGQKLGQTASIVRHHNDDTNEVVGAIGLRFMF